MRAAASWYAPILRPMTRLALWRLTVGFGFESERSRFQKGRALTAGIRSMVDSAASQPAARPLRPSESSFFQKGVPFTFGARSGFGAFAPRERDSSFFQNGVFARGSSNGGSSAAGTGGWTTGTTAGSGAGGSSGAASQASSGSGTGTAGGSAAGGRS